MGENIISSPSFFS